MARPAATLDQAVPIEDRVHRALGRYADVACEPADQQLADLSRSPVPLLLLEPDDQALDLLRQLIGVAERSSRAVAQRLQPVFLISIEDLVSGLSRYPELAAKVGHRLAGQQAGNKTTALLHYRT